jgi:hypothetical protein
MAELAEGKSGSSQFKRQKKGMALKILSCQKRGGVNRVTNRFVLPTYTIADIFLKT